MSEIDKLERMLDLCVLSNEGGEGEYEDKEQNEFHNLIKECNSALKLQELVKEYLEENKDYIGYKEYVCAEADYKLEGYGDSLQELQSLVEKSEKTTHD